MKSVLFIVLLILSSPAFGQGQDYDYHTSRAYDSTVRVYNSNLIRLFNEERSKRGLREYTLDATKQKSLDDKAKRMSGINGFHHDKVGSFGEIMIESPDIESPASAIKMWLDSPAHKAVVLSDRKDIKRVCAGSYFTPAGCYLVIRVY